MGFDLLIHRQEYCEITRHVAAHECRMSQQTHDLVVMFKDMVRVSSISLHGYSTKVSIET